MTGEKPTQDDHDTGLVSEEHSSHSEQHTPNESIETPESGEQTAASDCFAKQEEGHAETSTPTEGKDESFDKQPEKGASSSDAPGSGRASAYTERAPISEIERQLMTLISLENQEAARNMFNDLLRMGRDGYQFGVDLISELSTELTGVKSLQIIPKGPLELDVDMRRKKDLVLKCKYPIAPLIDVHAVTFGEDLNFGALVDRDKKALKMNIRKGLKLTIKIGPLEQTIDIKGTAMLSRNEKKQLVLSTTTTIPGTDSPITISIPLTMLFQQRKNFNVG